MLPLMPEFQPVKDIPPVMDAPHPLPILIPKVQIPPTRVQLVSRPRLLQTLDEGLHRKLTLISAPAGYGKSTLLSEWAGNHAWSLGWVTLESGDNDLERFLSYLISALQTADAGLSNLENILGARFSPQPLPPDAMLAVLVNQLASVPGRLVVVLDDYHLIDNPDIHGFLNSLFDNLPPNIHFIIATRAEPPLRLARLRAKDQLVEITERELRFTFEEAQAFFDDVMEISLRRDQVAELETRTEGWVTGLQLAGLSLKDRADPGQLIETLGGTHRYILDYLAEEVFSDLPPPLQAFLLRTSILDRLSPGLCDAVARPDEPMQSKHILEFLDAANLFLVPLDSQRQWYRFHSLFAEFLQDRLENQASDDLADLHRRAADWFAGHDLLSEAIGHSFAGEDFDRAADLIQSKRKDLLTRGELRTLQRWFESLPEAVIKTRPRLGLARAWVTLMRDPLSFRSAIDKQNSQIAAGFDIAREDVLTALAESEPDSERRAGLAEFAMLQAFAFRDDHSVDETINLFNAALAYFPDTELMLRGFTLAGLASTYARAGAIKQAEETFSHAAQTSLRANSTYGYVACTDWQATMQVEMGQLNRAETAYRQAIEKLASQGGHPLPLSGHVYTSLADVLLEWNDLAEALENVEMGLQVGIQVKDIDAQLTGYPVLARLLLALNRGDEARQAMQAGVQVAQETQSAGCVLEALAWQAQLALAAGDLPEARRWAAGRGLESGCHVDPEQPLHEVEQYAYIRLLLATGKASEALRILEGMIRLQEQMGRGRCLIESMALQALCLRALGRTEEAQRSLSQALLIAEPEGFKRVFIQEGPPMAALLRSVGAMGHSPEYVRQLLTAFGEALSEQDAVLDPLSEREIEVLRLVAAGLTNAEIAAELVIALSTVKTHINHIYNKLGASNRTQAVAKARQLQIID